MEFEFHATCSSLFPHVLTYLGSVKVPSQNIQIQDKENIYGLWDIVTELEKDFLQPLAQGLNFSRCHFKLKLEEPKSTEVTLMVGGAVLPDMSCEQKNEVIHSALSTFDMIECVLGQLNDVIAKHKNR